MGYAYKSYPIMDHQAQLLLLLLACTINKSNLKHPQVTKHDNDFINAIKLILTVFFLIIL